MNLEAQSKSEIRYLLNLALEGEIDEAQYQSLSGYLEGDREARAYYLDLIDVAHALRLSDWTCESEGRLGPLSMWKELAELEKTAPPCAAAEATEAAVEESPVVAKGRRIEVPRSVQTVGKAFRMMTAAALAAVVFLVLYGQWLASRGPVEVGTIEESLGAQWKEEGLGYEAGTRLVTGEHLLEEGYVRMSLDTGVEMILQAPVEFRLERGNGVYVDRGTLTAKVSSEGVGFTVRTATATVVDYGTEFGVQVGASGRVDAYVFKGEVDLRVGGDVVRHGETKRLRAGYRGAVREDGTLETAAMPSGYAPCVREIPGKMRFGRAGVRVDLADVVAGGNGFGTGTRGAGLDPATGRFVRSQGASDRLWGNAYRPVEEYWLVDGVFVPDGGEGGQVVSSQGHVYAGCPDTGRFTSSQIVSVADLVEAGWGSSRIVPQMGGQVYGGADWPAIYVHSNAGITFDVGRLRDLLADRAPRRFVAEVGMIETKEPRHKADIAVLVDGEVRFSRKDLMPEDGVIPVAVLLGEADQFLSLVVTEAGDEPDYDSVLFGRPAIELMERQAGTERRQTGGESTIGFRENGQN